MHDPLQKVALNNGSSEPQATVNTTFRTLSNLWNSGIMGLCAVFELVDLCKKPQHRIDRNSEKTLKELGLIRPDGRVDSTIKNIVLSAIQGSGADLTLVSPIKVTEAERVLQKKIEETIDSTMGVQVLMLELGNILSREQIGAFCDNTRNGSDLWDDFKAAHAASDNESFGFMDYVRQVLSTTAHPMS